MTNGASIALDNIDKYVVLLASKPTPALSAPQDHALTWSKTLYPQLVEAANSVLDGDSIFPDLFHDGTFLVKNALELGGQDEKIASWLHQVSEQINPLQTETDNVTQTLITYHQRCQTDYTVLLDIYNKAKLNRKSYPQIDVDALTQVLVKAPGALAGLNFLITLWQIEKTNFLTFSTEVKNAAQSELTFLPSHIEAMRLYWGIITNNAYQLDRDDSASS